MIRSLLLRAAACLAAGGALAAPLHDPFVEEFLVGGHADPAALEIVAGRPAGLLAPALVDTLWIRAATRALAAGAGHWDALLTAWPAGVDRDGFVRRLQHAVADLAAPAPGAPCSADDPFAAPRLTRLFFAALAAGDSAGAAATAADLAAGGVPGLHEGARAVWGLRASALAGRPGWPQLERTLAELGPWDTANAWALGVALRRSAGLGPFGPDADEQTAAALAGMGRTWLEASELAAAPFDPETRAALAGLVLPRSALDDHFARWPDPPARSRLQGWWARGQRRRHPGDAAHYEALARHAGLAPVWRMDLWRRASERRLLGGQWSAGLADLEQALELAADPAVAAGPSRLVRDWAEQACTLALAQGRTGNAAAVLELARRQAARVKDERFRASVALLEAWLAGTPAPAPGEDRVDRSRAIVRAGDAAPARAGEPADLQRLAAAAEAPPWELWRRWGLALTDVDDLDPQRQAAAAAYRQALAEAGDPAALLAAACGRLALRPSVLERLAAWSLDLDVQRLTAGGTPPLPSPVPGLAAELRGSQADLHALLGAALALGDMRGSLGVASVLPGTGLTRDEKRRFLYPLPAAGPVLDALLAAGEDPALLLAIARNESLFEPAVRSRAGALGWMQIMPFHYPQRGARAGAEHWGNPRVSVGMGARLVGENRRRYGADPYRLLAAYNAGPEAVARWDRQLGGGAERRLFLAWIGYTETRDYVEKVLVDRDVYHWILTEAPAAGAHLPAKE